MAELADGTVLVTGRLSVAGQPWLAGHAVGGQVLLPGTAFVELAAAAGEQAGCAGVEELAIQVPLLPAGAGVAVQVLVEPPGADGRREVAVHSRAGDDGPWVTHATGVLAPATGPGRRTLTSRPGRRRAPRRSIPGTCMSGWPVAGWSTARRSAGLRGAWQLGQDVFAEVALPDDLALSADRFGVHPALLDAALHALAPARPRMGRPGCRSRGPGSRCTRPARGRCAPG